jgi:hypothetical protein
MKILVLDDDDPDITTLADVRAQLAVITERLTHMATQDQVDTLTAQVTTLTDALTTAVTDIRQDIADIKAAFPAIDLTRLEASVSTLSTAVEGATALDSENPPPA